MRIQAISQCLHLYPCLCQLLQNLQVHGLHILVKILLDSLRVARSERAGDPVLAASIELGGSLLSVGAVEGSVVERSSDDVVWSHALVYRIRRRRVRESKRGGTYYRSSGR